MVQKKTVNKSNNKVLNYFVKSLNGMAYGFFATLIIGTMLKQVGTYLNITQFITWGTAATYLMGAGIGIGIAYQIEAKGLNLISAIVAGSIGAGTFVDGGVAIGNPLAAYIAVILAVEITKFVENKTPINIIIVPFTSIVVAGIVSIFIGPYISAFVSSIGNVINEATTLQPILMSIVVAVLMGMALTAPISSAAIGIMLGLSGLAAGAALAGCCTQMIGFAVMTAKDNEIGDVIAVGLGTSMLQFENIVLKPVIWLPTIITSAIIAPISTVVFGIESSAIGSGMGTAGLVGILETIRVMGEMYFMPIILMNIIAPAIIVYLIYQVMIKMNIIKKGDLSIQRL